MERRSVVAGGRRWRGSARGTPGSRRIWTWRVLGGLVGCVCAPLVAPVQSALALTVTAGNVSAVEGEPFDGQVATFSDLVGLGGCRSISSYASSVAWSDDGTSSTGTIGTPADDGLSCIYPVAAAHRFSQVGSALPFTVSVTGPFGGSGTSTASADVSPAPLDSQPVQISAVEGASFTAIVATFTDGYTGRPASHYTASVDWGDGSATADGTIVPVAGGGFEVAASHTYAAVGTYPTTVTISDPEGSTTTAASSTAVAAAPLSSTGLANTAIEDEPFVATVATFTDAYAGRPASRYSATVDWGDGSTTATTIVDDPAGGFDVDAGHTYANPGLYTTTVTISDPDGSQTTAVGQTNVADAPLSSAGLTIGGVAGQPVDTTVATFTDGDPSRAASYYSASVDWGDGASTPATAIVADPAGGFDVTATHTYASAGSYPVSVTITDPGGSQTTASGTASIAAPPPPPPPPTPPATTSTVAATPAATPAPTPSPTPTPAAAPAAPAPAPILPTPKVKLTSPRISAARTTISIGVTCPTGGASCNGVVHLVTLPAASSRIASLRRGTTIGSVLFVLHPGESKTFNVHIPSQILRLLREAGSARVQGVALAFGHAGSATSSGLVAKIATAKPR